MEDEEVLINVRDGCGRTPLFYALQDGNITKAKDLIEKGGDLRLRDSCEVSMFLVFIEYCISKNIHALQFTSELFQEEHQLKALTLAIMDIVYSQAPLLSVSGSPRLAKSYTILEKKNLLTALTFAQKQCSTQNVDNAKIIDKIASMIKESKIDVPLILSLLNQLGVSPDVADSDGNTALHYASILLCYDVKQEIVVKICKKLNEHGASFDKKNHQGESPLQFCLSSVFESLERVIQYNNWQSSMEELVEVFKFLLSNRSSITKENIGFSFKHIILIIQKGLQLNEEAARKHVFEVLIRVLELLSPKEKAVRNAVNNIDTQLNSPLHIWASIELKSPEDYTSFTGEHTFEIILQKVLGHLLKCGAKLNPRNANEQTPLHMCRTWTAMKLLLDAGANPNDVDSSGQSPLLVAAKDKNSIKKDSFYADVTEKAETFWKSALEKGLDPWLADKQGESLLRVLIESGSFELARALVKLACEGNSATKDLKSSLLNIISKDSKHTHWKTILVQIILDSARTDDLNLDSPLRFCCRNIVQAFNNDRQLPPKKRTKNRGKKIEEKEEPSRHRKKRKQEENEEPSRHRKKRKRKQEEKEEPSRHRKKRKRKQEEKEESSRHRKKRKRKQEEKEEPSKHRKKRKRKQEEKEEPNEEHLIYDSVHCKIAKQFLSYGVNIHHRDSLGTSCLDIARNYPFLHDLLAKPIDIDTIDKCIHWISNSVKYRDILGKVARRRECNMVDKIWCYRDHIATGSFGLIFAGINRNDGREVAVKRIEKLGMNDPKDKEEIENLADLAYCKHVVSYISIFEVGDFSYIVLELMEGNLKEYLDRWNIKATQATHHCKDIVMGLEFLHKQKIVHRNLKPQNILYKVHPQTCLKIAGFGGPTTVYNGKADDAGCWIAAEVLKCKKVDKSCFDYKSDVFSCGLLLYYIHSGKKHPFDPTDCASKSESEIAIDRKRNIMDDEMKGWDNSIPPEATHLVKRMVKREGKGRPSAEEALEYPLFWSDKKKVEFLKAVGNQEEFKITRTRICSRDLDPVQKDLRRRIRFKNGSWIDSSYLKIESIYNEMKKAGKRDYETQNALELLRLIRNAYQHIGDKRTDKAGTPFEKMLFERFLFLYEFPDLLMEVYKAVTTVRWDKTRNQVKLAMSLEL